MSLGFVSNRLVIDKNLAPHYRQMGVFESSENKEKRPENLSFQVALVRVLRFELRAS